jgi:uncharacterized protein (DUF1800 family)
MWPNTNFRRRHDIRSAGAAVAVSRGCHLDRLGGSHAAFALSVALVAIAASFAAGAKPPKSTPKTNPAQYAAFAEPLNDEEQIRHALNRLTFGARPGDVTEVEHMGLRNWLDLEMHPERAPENPALNTLLQPFESMRISIRTAYLEYPPRNLILQAARGTANIANDDPEFRAAILRIAARYRRKQEQKNQAASASAQTSGAAPGDSSDMAGLKMNPQGGKTPASDDAKAGDANDDSDLEGRTPLSSVLTPEQVDVLEHGKPEEKQALLAGLPLAQTNDFVYALNRQQRQRLFALAPVDLRRRLVLATNPQQVIEEDLVQQKMLRAIYGTHQLNELMVDFWYNHFNVFLNKNNDRFMVPTYERDAIRPHVWGKFRDLLIATAESPAMLVYLDNALSVSPDAPQQKRRPGQPQKAQRRGLNENYGRELLELHTLGVDGGYTQKDVIEVARCFTGWTVTPPRRGGEFEYNDKVHDKGAKVVLGHKIPAGGGMNDGLKVIDLLCRQPATAQFISLKLARRFVADDPPPSLVNRMADTFRKTDGDLRAVVETMLNSPEFWSRGAYRAKIKTPFEMVVSAARASNANVASAIALGGEVQRLGEPLYRKIEPTGYSSANSEWVSSASLLERMNFALALAHNRIPNVKVGVEQWSVEMQSESGPLALAQDLLNDSPSDATRQAIDKALHDPDVARQLAAAAKVKQPEIPSLVAGLVLGSPDFQRR